jgi:lipopolysaccharide biosynthesis protein
MPDWQALSSTGLPASPAVQDMSEQRPPSELMGGLRMAVIIHAYYLEPLPSFLQTLSTYADVSAIVLTTDTRDKVQAIHPLLEPFRRKGIDSQVVQVENRGRDVLPFWRVLKDIACDFDYFLKFHMKCSAHGNSTFTQLNGQDAGQAWTDDLLACLLPAPQTGFGEIAAFMRKRDLGAIFPRPWSPVEKYGWGDAANLNHAVRIMAANHVPATSLFLPLIYPVGNMFYGNVKAFLAFAEYFLAGISIPKEPVPQDGSVLHAIERCYAFLLADRGWDVAIAWPCLEYDGALGLAQSGPCAPLRVIFPMSRHSLHLDRDPTTTESLYIAASDQMNLMQSRIQAAEDALAVSIWTQHFHSRSLLRRAWDRLCR